MNLGRQTCRGGAKRAFAARSTLSRIAFALLVVTATSGIAPASASAESPKAGGLIATDLRLSGADEQSAEVRVAFTAVPKFTARFERAGLRLLVDVAGAEVRGAQGAITRQQGPVGGVMMQTFETPSGPVTRVLVTLLEKTEHTVKIEGKELVIRLGGAAKTSPVPTARLRNSALKAGGTHGTSRVRDVRFDHRAQADRVVVELSADTRYQLEETAETARLVLRGAALPANLERTLDVAAFGGVVRSISSYGDPGEPNVVVIEVERAAGVHSKISRQGPSLIWRFFTADSAPSSVSGVGKDGGVARRSRTVSVESLPEGVPQIETRFSAGGLVEDSQAPDQAAGFGVAVLGQQRARYTGRRIDLDLKDADIHNVLRMLADVGRVNVITSDDVSGSVSIRMRNVPWDQALDVVLQSKSLGMVRQGNMIRVAPLAELEKERELEMQRRAQEARLAPLETRLIPVSYADADDIQARAQPMLSGRGSIAVDERTNVLIVRDIAGNLNQVEELTRALDTQTPQVLVEARIVEATSRYLRDVGIQWGGDASFSAATGNPTGLVFPNSIGAVGGASDADTPTGGLSPFSNNVPNPNFAVNLPATVGTGTGGALGLTFGSVDNTINLAVRLSAAESTGMLRILSSPRILTLDNREARISQGTLIPFSQISAQGVQTTFQEAKLQLLVKPHVTADGSVTMKVKINRDEPDFNQTSPRGDPTILKREAETELLVMDGHTAVIGGIFTRNTGRNLDQVPFFGDIPLLGLLFQRRRASDTRGELVIFLTPRIVNRAEALGR